MGKKDEEYVLIDDGAFVDLMKRIEKEAIAKVEKELAEEAKKDKKTKKK